MIVDQAVYRGGRGEEGGDLSETLATLRAPGAPDEDFLWVGLKDPGPEEFDVVVRELDLHPLAVEDARSGDERAKIETYGESADSFFAVVKTLRYLEATSDIETGEVFRSADLTVVPNELTGVPGEVDTATTGA